MSPKDPFMLTFHASLSPGMAVLDLGAGKGTQAASMATRGMRVTAVDRREDPHIPGVDWHVGEVESWIAALSGNERYDGVLLRNLIQFLPSSYVANHLVPALLACLHPRGVVAIETFSRPPEPSFATPLASLWTVPDLKSMFLKETDLEVVFMDQRRKEAEGLDGVRRVFHISDLVLRLP